MIKCNQPRWCDPCQTQIRSRLSVGRRLAASFVLLFMIGLMVMPLRVAEATELVDEIQDPLESYNRHINDFNEWFDINLLMPVAQGYQWITPGFVRRSVTNFFNNVAYPKRLVSSLLRGEAQQAAQHTGAFLLNTSVGLFGILDIGSEVGIDASNTDFAVALADHGVPAGPYLVLPFWGPSTVRDTAGRVVDIFLDPLYWLGVVPGVSWQAANEIGYGATALDTINTRSELMEAIRAARESSLDYYLFIQSSYYQYRAGLLGVEPDNSEPPFDPHSLDDDQFYD